MRSDHFLVFLARRVLRVRANPRGALRRHASGKLLNRIIRHLRLRLGAIFQFLFGALEHLLVRRSLGHFVLNVGHGIVIRYGGRGGELGAQDLTHLLDVRETRRDRGEFAILRAALCGRGLRRGLGRAGLGGLSALLLLLFFAPFGLELLFQFLQPLFGLNDRCLGFRFFLGRSNRFWRYRFGRPCLGGDLRGLGLRIGRRYR